MSSSIRTALKRLRFEQLEDRRLLSVDLTLMANINKTAPWGGVSDLTSSGDFVFFETTDDFSRALWRTDGTNSGTIKLAAFGNIAINRHLTDVNGTLYFLGNDAAHGIELWKSDGTVAGTKLVKDQTPGIRHSNLDNFVRRGNVLFFTKDGNLMRSSGTDASTVKVVDVNPNGNDNVSDLVLVGNSVYFKAKVDASDYRIFRTEGTSATTSPVNIAKGKFNNLSKIGDSLYFSREKAVSGAELWKTVGATTSVSLAAPNISRNAAEFTDVNGVPYFEVAGSIQKVDAGRVVAIKDVGSGAENLYNFQGRLYFSGSDSFSGSSGYELWTSDGTTAGTFKVKEIAPGMDDDGDPLSSYPRDFTSPNGKLFFVARGEIWTTDGTEAGTVKIESDDVLDLIKHKGTLYFSRYKDGFPESTSNIFVLNPNTGDSKMIIHSPLGPGDANPSEVVVINGMQYFAAEDGLIGRELWKYNPGTGKTTLVRDLEPGPLGNVNNLSQANGSLYFTASSGARSGLWKSDGTSAGTVFLSPVTVRKQSETPTFVNVNGTVFFNGQTEAHGYELWKTDGTVSGTTLVRDIYTGGDYYSANSSSPTELTVFNNKLYFSAYTREKGRELWTSDGTVSGTMLVSDLFPGRYLNNNFPYYGFYPNSSTPRGLTVLNGALYFVGEDSDGTAFWKSDGTAAGTVAYEHTGTSRTNAKFSNALVNDELYYALPNAERDVVLWKTDGTVEGTMLVKDVRSSGSSAMQSLTNAGGQLYFVASDGVHGSELWKSDGTAAGTQMVADIRTASSTLDSAQSSSPANLTYLNNVLFFTANNGVVGRELWRTNGTAEGVTLVRDLYPGRIGSDPANLKVLRGKLVLAADSLFGRENWIASSSAPTLRNLPTVVEYSENRAKFLAPAAVVADADTPRLFGGRLSVFFENSISLRDRFFVATHGGIRRVGSQVLFGTDLIGMVINSDGGRSLTIDLTVNATLSSVSKLLQAITFETSALLPPQSRRALFTLTDGEGAVANASIEIRITIPSAPPFSQSEGESSESIFSVPSFKVPDFSIPSLTQPPKLTTKKTLTTSSPIAAAMRQSNIDRISSLARNAMPTKANSALATELSKSTLPQS